MWDRWKCDALTALGYQPVWQDIFGAEEGDLREMLRRRLAPCDGVIQLIGRSYGAEPPAPDEAFGRVSYTQYEALHARATGKKVWSLLLDESFPADSHEPEPDVLRALQEGYRARIAAERHLFHSVRDPTALALTVHQLRDELARLRRRWSPWAALVLVLLGVLVFFAVRGMKQGDALQKQNTELAAKVDTVLLQVLREIPQAAALSSRERDAIEWARVQHGIAFVLNDLGRAREVEPILRAVAAEHERVLGAEHRATLASRNNLAITLTAQGKAAEAEQEHRAVLAIRERVPGAEHPDVSRSCLGLAVSLLAQDKPKAALEYARRARDGFERTLGEEHPKTKLAQRLCEELEAAAAR